MSKTLCALFFSELIISAIPGRLFAAATTQPFLLDDDDDVRPTPAAALSPTQSSNRYFFGLLDHRSSYGQDFFPDPFIGPEFDSEQQIELDYLHSENHGTREDEIDAGFEWNVVGQLTIAGEFGWDSEHQPQNIGENEDSDDGPANSSGFENVDLAIYHPLFEYVSNSSQFDYTAVARLDVGIPTRTPVSGTDVQLAPYLAQLLRLGAHASLQAWTGSQFTIGPDQHTQFIYGALLGYELPHGDFPLPLTEKITPLLELDGQTPFSGNAQDALFGAAGVDINFKSTGELHPAIEIGFQFPLDQGARDQLQWGVLAEFRLEL
jgi:hypothetical protein